MLGMGFDSGGTNTTVTALQEEGIRPIFGECRQSISRARGEAESKKAAKWIIDRICEQNDSKIVAWIGAAGYSGAWEAEIKDIFDPYLDKLKNSEKDIAIFIANDAVSLLKAPPLNSQGIIAIVGTGSVVMGTHPEVDDGKVIKRGGVEWVVSDEGAGVWMTIQAVKLLLEDIQLVGAYDYQSALLEELIEYFRVPESLFENIPEEYQAIAKIEHLASTLADTTKLSKRDIAGFIYPSLFRLASLSNPPHDPIAAQVIANSVKVITEQIDGVAKKMVNYSDSLKKVDALAVGSIAHNSEYSSQLFASISNLKLINSFETDPTPSDNYAKLAFRYANANSKEKELIARSFDPLHSVTRLF